MIPNKERVTQLKKKLTHTNTHKRTHSCAHLFVSEPVGICHMPGRFCNLGRWYSTIKRSQSLNQSPACHMKGPLRFVLHQHACPLSMQCLVCKLPLLSHKNPFSCLAVPQKHPFLARLFLPIFHHTLYFLQAEYLPCDQPHPLPHKSVFSTLFCLGLFNNWPECKTVL